MNANNTSHNDDTARKQQIPINYGIDNTSLDKALGYLVESQTEINRRMALGELKKAKVIKIMAVLEIAKRIKEKELLTREENSIVTSETLYQRYRFRLAASSQEELIIIILNKNKNVIYEKILYHGDDNHIPINYRDILRLLLIHNGYYFYLVHNHPNGSFFPSEADESLTKKIVVKARSLGATLLDHIIISQSGYYSFLHENLLKQFKKEENI